VEQTEPAGKRGGRSANPPRFFQERHALGRDSSGGNPVLPPVQARRAVLGSRGRGALAASHSPEEQQNVYLSGTRLLRLAADWKHLEGSRVHSLVDWNRLWNQSDTGSVEGNVRFHGGDLLRRAKTAPETLTPEDFRLRPDSAGYRVGPDGKDFGADVDLVGPGPAYERWKKTLEYQQWLKETGQKKDEG
jgi:hypothetical protein